MAAKYVVTNGVGNDSEPVEFFGEALALAVRKQMETRKHFTVVNLDGIDVCEDADCKACNYDGLTAAEREMVDDAGLS